jgi:hypothetical protein
VHVARHDVYRSRVSSQRLNITLDSVHAAKLARLAARVHVNEGTLARSLLSSAIDDLNPDPANVAALLHGIDGAWERAQLGATQAAAGDTIAVTAVPAAGSRTHRTLGGGAVRPRSLTLDVARLHVRRGP